MSHQYRPSAEPSPRAIALRQRVVGQRLQPRLIAARRGQHARRVLERREPGRLRDRIDLVDQRRGGGEGPGMDVERGEVVERVREQAERAGVARDAHAAGRERVPELVVPEILREAARQPQPAPVRLRRRRARANARSARESGATDAAYPSVNRVTRASRSRSAAPAACAPARRARGLGDLALVRAGAEAAGEHRRRDRLEVGLAGHRGVQRIEPPGRLEQQRRRVAPAPAGEHDLRAQPLQPRALELVDRPELGGGQEVGRGRGVGDVELRLRRGERALDAHGGVRRQLGRPLQERGGRGQPAAALRAVGRARHLRGHRLVRRRRRVRAMPGATVGIDGPGRSRRRAPGARRGGRSGRDAR